MSVTLPTIAGSARDAVEVATQDGIRVADFEEVGEILHWLFERHGHRGDAHLFDPAWKSTDTTNFKATSESASHGFGQLSQTVTPHRWVDDGGTLVYAVQTEAFGEDFEIEQELVNSNGATIVTDVFAGPTTAAYRSWLLWDPSTDPTQSGVVEMRVTARAITSEARIWQAQIDELLIPTSAFIPTSLF